MNTRRHLLHLLGAGALAPLPALAQPAGKVWRIGMLNLVSRKVYQDSGWHQLFIQGMREHGRAEGRDYVLEERFGDDDATRLPALAGELVAAKVDLIVTATTPATLAAQQATSAIPIVVLLDADPVGNGLALSLARPGKNITGLSTQFAETTAKMIDYLRQIQPKLTRLGVLSSFGNRGMHGRMQLAIGAAAQQHGVQLVGFENRAVAELAQTVASMPRERVQGFIMLPDQSFHAHAKQIADAARQHRLLSAYGRNQYPEVGGLLSYGLRDATDNWRLGAKFIDRIIKGAKPGDIPFEQPTQFDLVLNLKTAKALGIKMPQTVLLQATKVIE